MTQDSIVVDRAARDVAAERLRRFAAGRVTNNEFEGSEPDTRDPAIRAIWDTCWCFYCDMEEHRLEGDFRLDPDFRRMFARWVIFLDSDRPYVWPKIRLPGIDPRRRIRRTRLGRLCNLDSVSPKNAAAFLAAGHYPVWPFASAREYKSALKNPKRLSGQRSNEAP